MSPRESTHERWRPQRTELVWPAKRTQVDRVALPFHVVVPRLTPAPSSDKNLPASGARACAVCSRTSEGVSW